MYLFVLLAYRHHSWWRKKQFLKCFDNVIKGVLLSPLLNALDGYFGSQNPTRKVIMSSNTLIINDWHQNLILLKTFIAKTVQIQKWDQNQKQKTHSVRFTDFGKYFVDKWSSSAVQYQTGERPKHNINLFILQQFLDLEAHDLTSIVCPCYL